MAAATVVTADSPERNLQRPLSNLNLHRTTLTVANTNTHDTGLSNIAYWAISSVASTEQSLPIAMSQTVAVTDLTSGVFTFATSGSQSIELLVWTRG